MTKHSKSGNSSPPSCFSSILQRIVCSGNLPTHPSPPDQILEKHGNLRSFSRPSTNVAHGSVLALQTQAQAQVSSRPGVIARLMGLDSLPNTENITTLDSLFRSKSLNSLHFLPDFDPARAAFHRRARTSASFHEQGRNHSSFVTEVDDLGCEVKQLKKGGREKEATSKASNECKKDRKDDGRRKDIGSKKRFEERYTNSSRNRSRRPRNKDNVGEKCVRSDNLREKSGKQRRKLASNNKGKLAGKIVGSTTVSSKRKVDHKQDMCIEAQSDEQVLSRSPVSVLDHPCMDISPSFEGEGRQILSNSRTKTSPKIKINDDFPQDIMPQSRVNYQDYCDSRIASKQELVKAELEAADYFVDLKGSICKLAEEEHIGDSTWVTKYELLKVHFVEEFSSHLGQQLLDLLVDELLDEIIMSL